MKKTIITIKGGLGNQLFQYAHGVKLSQIDSHRVIFDTSFFTGTTTDIHRPFLLDKFNINESTEFIPVKTNFIQTFYKKVVQKVTGKYDYFQHEDYFKAAKDQVLKEFTLKNPLSQAGKDALDRIKSQNNSVSLHIRRGDYVQNPDHQLVDLNYYYKAVEYIKSKVENPVFCIFSDDINWVTENLHIDSSMYISNSNIPDYEELILMSECSHNIIANSTFSWWGAYLNKNQNKIVVSPTKWTPFQKDIVPKEWIQIS